MSLQRAEFADFHSTCPTFSIGRAATYFTCDDQLRGWIAVDTHVGKIIEQNTFATFSLKAPKETEAYYNALNLVKTAVNDIERQACRAVQNSEPDSACSSARVGLHFARLQV